MSDLAPILSIHTGRRAGRAPPRQDPEMVSAARVIRALEEVNDTFFEQAIRQATELARLGEMLGMLRLENADLRAQLGERGPRP